MGLRALDMPELQRSAVRAETPAELRDPKRSIFDVIRERDMLVHHPFDSFTRDGRAIPRGGGARRSRARDQAHAVSHVGRHGDRRARSPRRRSAASRWRCIVELKARFDEANNITLGAARSRTAGVHVAYGSAMLKTHAKTALVVRREPDGIRRYVHIGTGNYNSRTARLYTDVGLFTCSPSIGADVSDLFNSLTGYLAPAAVSQAARRAGRTCAIAVHRADRARERRTRARAARRASSPR